MEKQLKNKAMSASTASRVIKEELMRTVPPELYSYSYVASRKRKRPVREVVLETHVRRKRRRTTRYRGRKARALVRPGTAVVLGTARRRRRAVKRAVDEVMTDGDILAQAMLREGEFLYGKRARTGDYVPLDTYNPTPNMRPATPQQVLAVGRKRGLHPTVEVLTPKRYRVDSRAERSESNVQVSVPLEGGPGMLRANLKVRPVKRVAPGLGIRTVDVELPSQTAAAAALGDLVSSTPVVSVATRAEPVFAPPAAEVITPVAESYGTELMDTAPVTGDVIVQRRRRPRSYKPVSAVIPEAVYHPTIVHERALPRRVRTVPAVTYHPSIDLPATVARTTVVD